MARGNRSGASRVEINDGEALRTKAARALQGIELTGDLTFSPAALAFLGRRPGIGGERKAFYLRRKLARADMDRELNIQKVRVERWVAGEEVGKNAPSTTPASKHSRRRPLMWDDEDDDGDDDDGDVGGAGGDAPAPAEDVGGAGDA